MDTKNGIKPTITLTLDALEIICKIAAQGILIQRTDDRIASQDGDVDELQREKGYAIRQIGEYIDEYTIKGDPTVRRIISDEALDLIEMLGE